MASAATANGRNGRGPGPGDVQTLEHWGPAMVALLVGAFMALMDSSIVNVAIPTLEHVFGADTAQVEWIVTIYLLALGVVVPTSGWLGDRVGFKRLYLWSMFVFILGSALCAVSFSLPLLIAARVLQALGGGMIMPTTMAMVYRLVPRHQLGTASGVFGVGMLLAPAIGPALGGWLVEYVNWRWIFTVNVPIGLMGLFLAGAVLPEFAARDAGPFDLWGFVTSAAGLFSLLLALSEGATWGWSSPGIVWLLFASGVALIAFVWIELAGERPLLDLRVFRYTSFSASSVFVVGVSIALFAGAFYIPVFLQLVRGMGALQSGLTLMPGALASGVMMPLAGRLYDRVGPLPSVVAGTVILAVSTFLMRSISLDTTSLTIAVWMALRGVGMGLAMMPAMTAGMAAIPVELVGRASSLSNILQRVAGSLGIAMLTVLLGRGQAAETVMLAAQYAPGSPRALAVQGLISGLHLPPALGLYEIYGYVQAIAFTRSLDGIFVLLAGISAVILVPVFFIRKPAAAAAHVPAPAAAGEEPAVPAASLALD
jgi:EmrB/QacA subfamily drug resistance transporter